jgi:hypothetical protein
METKEWIFIDKDKWSDGPWNNEPDKRQWLDSATGMLCLMRRASHSGCWCGYVGVPKDHPYYGEGYNDVPVDVHGGLTFSDLCSPEEGEHAICHVVGEGEDDNVWWLGFDCAHGGDLAPAIINNWMGDVYRNMNYVISQVEHLAAQLHAVRA